MLEQLIFIILSIILFVIIFFKMIKKNDTSYVPILAIEALGITIDFIVISSSNKINIIVKFLIYLMSVVLPFIIIILEKNKINVMAKIKMVIIDMYMTLGNYKAAKEKLIEFLEQDNDNYDLHKKLAFIYEKEG